MNMPRFTAEASLYTASRHYQMAQAPAQAGGAVRPAIVDLNCYNECHISCTSDCFGDHGFPSFHGNALGACLRACIRECRQACAQ
jgi:hypothetical protein